ncbi:MAG: orotidine-5'-phosphate decarboxylase [Dehalococcoidia bacterium]|nr:orotidine-5'-phosphate decarboxylase [Dehalococcoidia bacterium]MSQ17024.1 orotidine-5'-phosphate decarboxylase [Dehalococcoidia bacterium]
MSAFTDRLEKACDATRSLLCVGLDVDPARMPVPDVFQFNQAIVDATADLVCAYKPNLAFYEALGLPGLEALARTVEHIRRAAPDAVIIGDGKRGDIGPSGEAYAKAMFQVWGFDAATINAWGGQDTVAPWVADASRGAFIWCRGSNPGSADLQDLAVAAPGPRDHQQPQQEPLYRHLAQAVQGWNQHGNLGLVVGATVPQQLAEVRRLCPSMPLLIPGVGAQGGELEEAVRLGTDSRGRLGIINSSRGIIYASRDKDFPQAARREAARLRDAMNRVLEVQGKGWP